MRLETLRKYISYDPEAYKLFQLDNILPASEKKMIGDPAS